MINNIENKIEYLQKCSLKNRCFWKLDFLLEKFLEPEELTGANRWFFPSCNYLTNSTKEIKFIKVGTIMIVQLQHYIILRGNPIKDNRKVKCSSDPLKIHVSCENTVSFSASFSLQARINHWCLASGALLII